MCYAPFTEWVWLSLCIAKVVGVLNLRGTSMPRSVFEGLEPCDGKLSCRVLRGLGVSNDLRLPGLDANLAFTKMLIFQKIISH